MVDGKNLNLKKNVPSKLNKDDDKIYGAVCSNGQLYTFLVNWTDQIATLLNFSSKTETWRTLTQFSNRREFCVYALMDKILVFGGRSYGEGVFNSCIVYCWKDSSCKQASGRLNAKRFNGAACAVYRGKFVVTGGNSEARGGNLTKTVEAYDHVDFHAEHGAGH